MGDTGEGPATLPEDLGMGQPEAGHRRAPCLRGELPVSRELGQNLPVTAVSEPVAWRPHTAKDPVAGPAPEVSGPVAAPSKLGPPLGYQSHHSWSQCISPRQCQGDVCFKRELSALEWRRQWHPYSSTLAWKIPWMEEPGGLQSMGLQRVRHD